MNYELVSQLVTFTPLLDAGNAYADGDVLCATAAISNMVDAVDHRNRLQEIVLVDKSDGTASDMELYFFTANVVFGTFNGAPSVSDADMAAYFQGKVSIYSTDFTDVGGSKQATKILDGNALPKGLSPASGTRTVYVAIVVHQANTYAAGDLAITFDMEWRQ